MFFSSHAFGTTHRFGYFLKGWGYSDTCYLYPHRIIHGVGVRGGEANPNVLINISNGPEILVI